jgi:hypothetical protein
MPQLQMARIPKFKSVFRASLLVLLLQPVLGAAGKQTLRPEGQGVQTLTSTEASATVLDSLFLERLEADTEDNDCSDPEHATGSQVLRISLKKHDLLPVQFWTRYHIPADSTSARSPPV